MTHGLFIRGLFLIMTLILSACATKPAYQPTYTPSYSSYSPTPTYTPAPYVPPRPAPTAQTNNPPLTYTALLRFEYDCAHRTEQLDLLQDQFRKKTFYRVDGVDGNEYPDRISKRYFSLVRYRIWSLRLGCKGSSVEQSTQAKMRAGTPTKPPETMPRCYFEEVTEAKTDLNKAEGASETVISKRKEICTNYPLMANKQNISVGDLVDPERELDKNIPYIPNLRQWNGNIFQLVSKTEMHMKEVVKFTVVLMWSGRGWVVVDKF